MFAGTLKTFSIISLIQTCHNDGSTGTIEFSRQKTVMGTIGFKNGNIVNAGFLGAKGIGAIKQLMLIEGLDFKFNEKIILPGKNINKDINFVLIDCSRYKDEAREYLGKIKHLFFIKYNIDHVVFYNYRHLFFTSPEVFEIKYFEDFDGKDLTVVYRDKIIQARIELLFDNKILTNDLWMFMKQKNIFI